MQNKALSCVTCNGKVKDHINYISKGGMIFNFCCVACMKVWATRKLKCNW